MGLDGAGSAAAADTGQIVPPQDDVVIADGIPAVPVRRSHERHRGDAEGRRAMEGAGIIAYQEAATGEKGQKIPQVTYREQMDTIFVSLADKFQVIDFLRHAEDNDVHVPLFTY